MKTLYEQLTENQKEQIKEHAKKYPAITADILEELNTNFVITKIKLGEALNTYSVFKPYKPFDFNEFYEIFENK